MHGSCAKLCDARGVEIIDSEQRARRLARAVATDIVLYNEKQLNAGADLSREIAEGRSHFCARVTPSLHWIFEEVVAGTALGKAAPSGTQAGAARVEAASSKGSVRSPRFVSRRELLRKRSPRLSNTSPLVPSRPARFRARHPRRCPSPSRRATFGTRRRHRSSRSTHSLKPSRPARFRARRLRWLPGPSLGRLSRAPSKAWSWCCWFVCLALPPPLAGSCDTERFRHPLSRGLFRG